MERIDRVRSLIREEVASIVIREIEVTGVIITITRVDVSRDHQYADIYFVAIPQDREEEVEKLLNKNIFIIQKALNKRLRMRPVPKIRIHIDMEEKQAAKIDEIIETLDA